jgi:hypothetical protein
MQLLHDASRHLDMNVAIPIVGDACKSITTHVNRQTKGSNIVSN